jgi:DNA-binding FrmR family transcriptional regulator
MSAGHTHASHPAIANWLRRAIGHLRCVDPATQVRAVERAVAKTKRSMIRDHADQYLTGGGAHDLAGIKTLTKMP